MIIAILTILFYAIVMVAVLEFCCWAVSFFLVFPPKVKQLLYALVGVYVLIQLVRVILPHI